MFDWDGDGKQDWQDDALFHNVINDSDSNKDTHSTGSRNGCLPWVIGILFVLWIIGKIVG